MLGLQHMFLLSKTGLMLRNLDLVVVAAGLIRLSLPPHLHVSVVECYLITDQTGCLSAGCVHELQLLM